jgi:predicted ABC-class ATPase
LDYFREELGRYYLELASKFIRVKIWEW